MKPLSDFGDRLGRLIREPETHIDARLLELLKVLPPHDEDVVRATRELRPHLVEVASELFSVPFLSAEWSATVTEFMELAGVWRSEPHDGRYAAPETRLHMLCPPLGEALVAAVRNRLGPVLRHLWGVNAGSVRPPFVIRYAAVGGPRGMPLHHDIESDVTVSVALNDGFTGGGICFPGQGYLAGNQPIGTALLFPGRVTHRHMARDIESGVRYVLTIWTEYVDMKPLPQRPTVAREGSAR